MKSKSDCPVCGFKLVCAGCADLREQLTSARGETEKLRSQFAPTPGSAPATVRRVVLERDPDGYMGIVSASDDATKREVADLWANNPDEDIIRLAVDAGIEIVVRPAGKERP